MEQLNIIAQQSSVLIITSICIIFLIVGVFYSKNFLDLNNYLVANRSVGTLSLTTSLISSALGAWILFGPASAATWGGIGAVIGYALGSAFPLLLLIFIGQKFRKEYPNCRTLIEVIRVKYGKKLFKLILVLSFFYMTIFLIAEVTAVSLLIKYLSGTDFWITALIIIFSSLLYTLYGGLKASIFTDNIQFILFFFLLLISFSFLINFNLSEFNFAYIKQNKPDLLSLNNITNLTAGFTFFIAVAATNLFHQGNWQRVYAAKSEKVLKRSLLFSFIFIVPVVFGMGFSGLIAVSQNQQVIPDLAFFSLVLKEQKFYIAIVIIFLAVSLTVSSIDTLINALSSLVIVDVSTVFKSKHNKIILSRIIIIIISIITFIIASKGLSILYLFLLADLLCCAASITVFYSFYNKKINEKTIYFSIIMGLIGGLMFFPTPDFSSSLLVGILLPINIFPMIISQYLLFFSFLIATFLPVLFWRIKFNKQ
jgi:Na+/proline symporter